MTRQSKRCPSWASPVEFLDWYSDRRPKVVFYMKETCAVQLMRRFPDLGVVGADDLVHEYWVRHVTRAYWESRASLDEAREVIKY